MSDTLSLLKEMRGRLGMYVGSTSLTKLAAFLRGYDYAAVRLGTRAPDPFLAGFRDWIHQRYQSSSRSWEDTILSQSADEADAVGRFWELLDEYARQSTPERCASANPMNAKTAPGKPLQLT
jgi:hypothetical protein